MSSASATNGDHFPDAGTMVVPPVPATLGRLPTPMDMLDRAIANGAGIDVLTKLMDLQERWERNTARRAFDEAVADAKAAIPIIRTNRKGHNSKRYADFAAFAEVVDPIIGKHGLSYRFRTTQNDRISVTCVLSHRGGHSEETTLSGPADNTGSKNAIQAIGSTLTYLQRYSLKQALGLAASDDDDGKSSGDTLADDQVKVLAELAKQAGDLPAFLKWLDVEAIKDIPAGDYQRAEVALRAKIKANAKMAEGAR